MAHCWHLNFPVCIIFSTFQLFYQCHRQILRATNSHGTKVKQRCQIGFQGAIIDTWESNQLYKKTVTSWTRVTKFPSSRNMWSNFLKNFNLELTWVDWFFSHHSTCTGTSPLAISEWRPKMEAQNVLSSGLAVKIDNLFHGIWCIRPFWHIGIDLGTLTNVANKSRIVPGWWSMDLTPTLSSETFWNHKATFSTAMPQKSWKSINDHFA